MQHDCAILNGHVLWRIYCWWASLQFNDLHSTTRVQSRRTDHVSQYWTGYQIAVDHATVIVLPMRLDPPIPLDQPLHW